MKKTFWDRRIPTLLGILVIVAGIAITTYLTRNGSLLVTRAGPGQEPRDVRITNISQDSFSVSYSTADQIAGSINFGSNKKLGQIILDERAQSQNQAKNYKLHYFTVKNLTPDTDYFFDITSDSTTYFNKGELFQVKTGPSLDIPSDQKTVSGKTVLQDGSAPSEAIIYLTSQNTQVISALENSDGTYTIPLKIRNSDLSSYYSFTDNAILKMLIVGAEGKSNISFSITQTDSIPAVILGNDYDFVQNENPITTSSSSSSFPALESTSSGVLEPEIISPKKDQGFSDQQPVFRGIAAPNKNVKITIHSDEQIQTQVTSDVNGNWNFRPSAPLSPGTHSITISTTNASGIIKTITQSFVVYASGSQFTEPTSPTPTAIPMPTENPLPSETPLVESPTPTPTIEPTITPVPTVVQTETPVASPAAPLAPSGPGDKFVTFGLLGGIITLVGAILLFAL